MVTYWTKDGLTLNRIPKILLVTILAAILLLGFAVPVNMAGNWYQQFMPNINNMPLSDVFFIDSLTGWAVTGNNTPNDSNFILKTTNAGDNWQIKLIAYRDFFRIRFINQNTGFVCGGFNSLGNILYKSTNGGDNWSLVNTPSVIYADDFSVLNEDTLWFVEHDGLEGGVFRTTNGGVNWVRSNLFSLGGNPDKIYMYNRNMGFASSSPNGSLYRTTNGGDNWSRITGADGFLDICFVDSLTGWKANGLMKKTTDGGLNWAQQTIPFGGIITGSAINSISIINRDTIWGVGGSVQYPNLQNRGILYRTTNSGNNWLFQIPDTSIHIFGYSFIQFINSKCGWVYTLGLFGGIHTTVGGDPVWITDVRQVSTEIPKEFRLYQNYPNPFNPVCVIKYDLPKDVKTVIKTYDILGREVKALVNEFKKAGSYSVNFDGSMFASGVYFYRIEAGDFVESKKMILVK